jgi:hypothetical protein
MCELAFIVATDLNSVTFRLTRRIFRTPLLRIGPWRVPQDGCIIICCQLIVSEQKEVYS